MNREKFYIPLILILAVLLLWKWQRKPETVTVEKPVYIQGERVYIKPEPIQETKPTPEAVKAKTRPLIVKETGEVTFSKEDLEAIIQEMEEAGRKTDTIRIPVEQNLTEDYYTVRRYSDTTKTAYGPIITANTVTENKLQLSQVLFDFKAPEKVVYKSSGKFLIGAGLMGNETKFIRGFNLNAAYQTKKGVQYEAGVWQINGLGRQVEAGVKFTIFGK